MHKYLCAYITEGVFVLQRNIKNPIALFQKGLNYSGCQDQCLSLTQHHQSKLFGHYCHLWEHVHKLSATFPALKG